jgi:hypothetical protein
MSSYPMSSEAQDLERRIIDRLALLPVPVDITTPEQNTSGCYEWRCGTQHGTAPSFLYAFSQSLHFLEGRLAGPERLRELSKASQAGLL